jgi:hypothetical protein
MYLQLPTPCCPVQVADEASEQLLASLHAVSRRLPAVPPAAAALLPGDFGGGAALSPHKVGNCSLCCTIQSAAAADPCGC